MCSFPYSSHSLHREREEKKYEQIKSINVVVMRFKFRKSNPSFNLPVVTWPQIRHVILGWRSFALNSAVAMETDPLCCLQGEWGGGGGGWRPPWLSWRGLSSLLHERCSKNTFSHVHSPDCNWSSAALVQTYVTVVSSLLQIKPQHIIDYNYNSMKVGLSYLGTLGFSFELNANGSMALCQPWQHPHADVSTYNI